ncbi:hypothetical protein NEOLEDRAFT_307697 [Neolentinus lepideus HHB14362 ss-1]|uniref:Uncharacterized protein n=1 Tax=Neolentinus lepideus HHB14362 ss-1 TaxID=1314782 RepID=A0A165VRX3_9AGAM|nr:hypothetical protein NEOLEDRAFT_307697 [Neolentinus lepideus HHB14362 ss-1]
MSQQHNNSPMDPSSSSHGDSPTEQRQGGDNNNSGEGDSPREVSSHPTPISREPTNSTSEREEGYPSWLPKRPPHPAPASTFTSVGMPTPVTEYFPGRGGTPDPFAFVGGRKATPRSVRIISMASQAERDAYARREPTDQTRVSGAPHQHARVWSRATTSGMSPTLFSAGSPFPLHLPRPRFRATGLHLELLRNPSWRSRLCFYLWPFFVFYDIPLQTFFDFNAVFILIQVAKFPDPLAPGVPGSGRNWALGSAAYIACWFAWIFVVFLIYSLIYSFYRRWRVKRPLMLPLYMSSSAFNFVCMTSYTNFSFFQHLRSNAFNEESNGSLRDGLAETFYFYSQNLPTVALLLPRAGLVLALLLTFWTPNPDYAALTAAGVSERDGTFFDPDGTLTGYAKGVLIANAAWTAWRVLVLLASWIGLWALSGHLFAGLCGPRYRWEEDDAEKATSVISDGVSDADALPWSWKECTRLRVQEAYEFCQRTRPPPRRNAPGEKKEISEVTVPGGSAHYEGMEQVMAAIGIPAGGAHYPPKRGVLSQDLFSSPAEVSERVPEEIEEVAVDVPETEPGTSVGKGKGRAIYPDDEAPLSKLPYPFTGSLAQVSSTSVPHDIPFPPSPVPPEPEEERSGGDEEEEQEEEEEEEVVEEEALEGSEIASSPRPPRSSASMSSLGRPVTSRYPFQFRRPGRGHSVSTSSHATPQSRSTHSGSTPSTGNSRNSHGTQSTGNRSSTDDNSPRSYVGSSPSVSGIPRPPRNPAAGRRRAGTVPSLPSSPSPVIFSDIAGGARASPRFRTESDETVASSSSHQDVPRQMPESYESGSEDESPSSGGMMEQPEAEGSQEAAEIGDNVALLTSDAGPTLSPRASLAHIGRHGSRVSLTRRGTSSRSGSGSRSRTNSSQASARSRAQSLIQSISAASRSSLDLVSSGLRSRTSSMARLEDSPGSSSDRSRSGSDAVRTDRSDASGSGSASDSLSNPDNHTFGHPLQPWREGEDSRLEEREDEGDLTQTGTSTFETPVGSFPSSRPRLRDSPSGSAVPSSQVSERTVLLEPTGRAIPGAGPSARRHGARPRVRSATVPRRENDSESPPDISTAAASFITAPSTMSRTSESTVHVSRTPESQRGGHLEHYMGAEGRREYYGPT